MILPEFDRIIVAFRGGGESKAEPDLTEEELFERRKGESKLVCAKYTKVEPEFLEVKRPIDETELRTKLTEILPEYDVVATTHCDDSHPEHKVLGSIVKEIADVSYGFFVNTQCLIGKLDKEMPDKFYHLTANVFRFKLENSKLYETQKHFLPNVMARKEYAREYLWRM